MDKVIIDGVDVLGCEFCCENPLHKLKHSCNIRGYEKDNGLHIHLKCKNNPNCYYKQLKRAKAEIEELKQDLHEVENACSCFESENADLRKENERLKEESEEKAVITKAYNDLVIEIISNIPYAGEIRPDNITPLDVLRNIKKQRKAYKQALQEIRDIANKHDYWRGSLQSATNIINEIEDKINSIIGAE